MNFDLHSPCKHCPFRTDVPGFIKPERAREIVKGLLSDQTFSCHKTVDYSDDDSAFEDGCHIPSEGEQHCAGALIFLEKHERPNQLMRVSERLGGYDARKLKMDAPVFETAAQMIAHMRKPRKQKVANE